jgi:hypothetical protein
MKPGRMGGGGGNYVLCRPRARCKKEKASRSRFGAQTGKALRRLADRVGWQAVGSQQDRSALGARLLLSSLTCGKLT